MRSTSSSTPLTLRFTAFLIAALLSGFSVHSYARIDLSALEHDGYGVTELRRPTPNVLTITAMVNGHKVTLIVDTGALSEGIILERDQLRSIGVSTGAAASATSATGRKVAMIAGHADRVVIGNVEISGVPVALGDMEARHMRAAGADGFLGAPFLRTCSGIIDLHNLRLYLRPPGKGHRVDLGPALRASGLAEAHIGKKCVVDVAINDMPAKMVLDTGAFLATADIDFAYKAHASVGGSRVGMEDIAGGVARTEIAHLKSFKIGGVSVSAPDLRLAKFPFYKASGGSLVGLLGMDILGRNGTIIDFGQEKLYFYPLQ